MLGLHARGSRRAWSRGRSVFVAILAGTSIAAVGSSCLKASAIDAHAYTEVACAKNAPVTVIVGASLDDLAQRMQQGVVSSTQSGCASGSDGYVGDLVLLPQRTDETIAFAVMTRADGQPSDQCGALGQGSGCIVAKRQVGFLNHEQLGVRVDLRLSCLGVSCPVDQTCIEGLCVSAVVPSSCPPPCGETGLVPGDAGSLDSSNGGMDGSAMRDSGAAEEASLPEGGDTSVMGAPDASEGGILSAQSCAPGGAGLTTCGTGTESCCASLPVTGGTYNRTYVNSGGGPTSEADPATVHALQLDKYLVTVARFRQFVGAWNGGSGWTPPPGSGKHAYLNGGQGLTNSGPAGGFEPGWVAADDSNITPTNANLACGIATWTSTAGANEKLPINCVNWCESYAFCIWDGGFLPSEAEWEYAAAGGSLEREYPWGSTAPGTANQYAIYNCNYPSHAASCSVSNVAPVGTPTLGAGLWGQLDLAGDAWEWNLDWNETFVDPCTDCAYANPPSSGRVFRGGTFSAASFYFSVRASDAPVSRDSNIGFRCARAP